MPCGSSGTPPTSTPDPQSRQSPVGALDAAGVDPEEQKQQTVEGQEARGPRHKGAEGWGRGSGQDQRGAVQGGHAIQRTAAPEGALWREVVES